MPAGTAKAKPKSPPSRNFNGLAIVKGRAVQSVVSIRTRTSEDCLITCEGRRTRFPARRATAATAICRCLPSARLMSFRCARPFCEWHSPSDSALPTSSIVTGADRYWQGRRSPATRYSWAAVRWPDSPANARPSGGIGRPWLGWPYGDEMRPFGTPTTTGAPPANTRWPTPSPPT